MLPSGDEELPGMSDIHPRVMYPPTWYREPTNRFNDRSFGTTLNPANSQKLSISPDDSLEHCCITGPTGSGKSTAILNLVLSDIYAGRSVLVIDPKADLVTSILERIPASRADDVVVIDPSDDNPVGFNPLALPGNPTLMADAILAVFKEIFSDSWGVRSQDVLSAALLTLVHYYKYLLLELSPIEFHQWLLRRGIIVYSQSFVYLQHLILYFRLPLSRHNTWTHPVENQFDIQ